MENKACQPLNNPLLNSHFIIFKSHYGVREANRQDVPSIAKMIQDLADYLGKRDELKIGEKELLRDGFRKHPLFHCVIAEERVENIEELNDHTPTQNLEAPKKNKEALGVAIYYFTYSTWEGPVLYVEDLFVTPNARGQGIGSSLMAAIAKIAKSCDCQRMQWVSPSSERTIGFYRKLGAKSMPDWRLFRMEKSDIEELSLASE